MAEPRSQSRATSQKKTESGEESAQQMAEEALISATRAIESLDDTAHKDESGDAKSFQPPELKSNATNSIGAIDIHLLDDVSLDVKIELGRTRMYVDDVLRLTPESVVELDNPAGEPVDIYVNEQHIARGEVLVIDDRFGVRITEIIQQTEKSSK